MEIILNDLPFSPVQVAELVDQSRVVLMANRNKTWARPLGLITDDPAEVRQYLADLRVDTKTDAAGADKYLGYCWLPGKGAPAAIWVKPRILEPRPPRHPNATLAHRSIICTLAHETAHVLTHGVHGHVWRRAYALILPLWLTALDDHRPSLHRLRGDITTVVQRYARRLNPYAQLQEVDRHVEAILRCKFYRQDDQLRFYRP